MVKTVVKPFSVGYGCYQEIENPTPHKFFFCRYYTIPWKNSQEPSLNTQILRCSSQRKRPTKKVGFIFEKVLDFLSLLWYVVVLTEKEAQPMKSMINELWHGNIIPQEDSRNNSKEMKVFSKSSWCLAMYPRSSFISFELFLLSSWGIMFPCHSSFIILFICCTSC